MKKANEILAVPSRLELSPGHLTKRSVFRAEIEGWAATIGVKPREIRIRFMVRKWGSCSTARRLTFNEQLLGESAQFRKRVIVEEMLHLKVPNHGRLFKALLKSYLEMSSPQFALESRTRHDEGRSD